MRKAMLFVPVLVSMLLAGEAMAWPGFGHRTPWIRPVVPVKTHEYIRPLPRPWESHRRWIVDSRPKVLPPFCWDGTRRWGCPVKPWNRVR
jgi:hypothetical protein